MRDTTRRQVMATAALGAAAAAVTSPASAQGMTGAASRGGKQNPRDKYPKPPFNSQS